MHLSLSNQTKKAWLEPSFNRSESCDFCASYRMVHPARFELATPGSEDQCSNPLSYGCIQQG